MKRVLIQGAFDILNYGHVRAFRFAKSRGDYLIVALNTNALLKQYKGRDAVVSWQHKKAIIESIRWVDKVIPAPEFSPLKLLEKHKIDVYMLSAEWLPTKALEIAYMKAKGGTVCITRRYKGASTTAIKAKLLEEHLNDIKQPELQVTAVSGGSQPSLGTGGNGSMPVS